MRRLSWDRVRRDDGVTLTELLLAIIILGVIVVPLANAFIGFMRNSDETTRFLGESHDGQIAAAYFAQDVQSVGARNWGTFPYTLKQSIVRNPTAGDATFRCGTDAAVVRFAWDDPTAATGTPTEVRVTYGLRTVSGENQLHRVLCRGSETPVSDLVLAHNVLGVPAVTCNPADCITTTSPGTQTVTMQLSIKDPAGKGSGLSVTLVGQRRQI